MANNTFGARGSLKAGDRNYAICRLDALEKRGFALDRLPVSIKVLIENLIRREDGVVVTAEQIEALAKWDGKPSNREISFMPARVLLQDLTGVPEIGRAHV